jgi:putative transposase
LHDAVGTSFLQAATKLIGLVDGRERTDLDAVEDENRRLKKLLSESMLDASTLKEMLGKNF